MDRRILIIVTNTDKFDKVGFRTGLWLSELVHFWNVVEKAGYEMEIASPSGGKVSQKEKFERALDAFDLNNIFVNRNIPEYNQVYLKHNKLYKVGKMLMFLYYLKTHYLIHVKSLSQP